MVRDSVILIAGKKRSGKDTFADMLADKIKNSKRLAYADPMKVILAETLGITLKELDKLKNNQKKPHRKYLQRFGQVAKEYFGANCWGEYLEHVIANQPKGSVSIVSDFRMPIEHVTGALTINVKRRGDKNTDDHVSEVGLDKFNFDVTIYNDSTLEDLEKQADNLVTKLYTSRWLS